MAGINGRNRKKSKGRRQIRANYPASSGRFSLDRQYEGASGDDYGNGESLESGFRRPGDWLEHGYLDQPDMEDRLASLNRGSFLDRGYDSDDDDDMDYEPSGIEDSDYEPEYDWSSDLGSDFDDADYYEDY